MNKACWLLLFALTPVLAAEESVSRFSLRAEPGPQLVGLRVVEQYDYSRTFRPLLDELGKPYQGERARPLQTLVWYPAERASGKPVTFGEYMDLGATETSFGKPKSAKGPGEWWLRVMKPVRASPMWSVRDAPIASGRFPIIIYAPSFSSAAWENADLCEYIASYGYVVIASPGMGVRKESTHDLAGVDAQARDISFLIGYAQTLSNTDAAEVAVIGFSWGGLSGLFSAARDNRIKALAALDGSMRSWPGLVRQSGEVNPKTMTLPLLFFKSQFSVEDQARLNDRIKSVAPTVPREDPYVLNEWIHGDLISVQMLGLVHPEFSSVAQRNENFWRDEFDSLQEADYGREDGMIGYAWVARYTGKFLDAYLKHDVQALQYLKSKPSEIGVPAHLMAVNFRTAQSLPPSLDSFEAAVGREGLDHAAEIYATVRKEHPDFTLDPQSVDSWGYELMGNGHFSEAVQVMKLETQLDSSSRAYVGLAEAYRASGQRHLALAAYRHALELDPSNMSVKHILDELDADGRLRD
ncbi:MAG: dienelactone hydrolase [Steroidobacteraceae bacterium]